MHLALGLLKAGRFSSLCPDSVINGNQPSLHGWVFDLHTGLINEVIDLLPGDQMVLAGQHALTNRYE